MILLTSEIVGRKGICRLILSIVMLNINSKCLFNIIHLAFSDLFLTMFFKVCSSKISCWNFYEFQKCDCSVQQPLLSSQVNSFHGVVILALALTVKLLFTFLEYLTVCDIHSYCPRIWLDLFELLMLLLYKGNKISCHVCIIFTP